MQFTQQIKEEIMEGALEYWINHNYLVAQGIKNSVEWLDEDEEEEDKDFDWKSHNDDCDRINGGNWRDFIEERRREQEEEVYDWGDCECCVEKITEDNASTMDNHCEDCAWDIRHPK